MKTKLIIFLLMGSIVFSAVAGYAVDADHFWEIAVQKYMEYLNQPDQKNAAQVLEILNEKGLSPELLKQKREFVETVFAVDNYNRLESYAQDGQSQAIKILFSLKKYADGAYSSYISITLGSIITTHPAKIINGLERFINENPNNIYNLGSIIGNLGPEYVDNDDKKLKEIEKRYTAISNTEGVSKLIKELCLCKLENKIYRIKISKLEEHECK